LEIPVSLTLKTYTWERVSSSGSAVIFKPRATQPQHRTKTITNLGTAAIDWGPKRGKQSQWGRADPESAEATDSHPTAPPASRAVKIFKLAPDCTGNDTLNAKKKNSLGRIRGSELRTLARCRRALVQVAAIPKQSGRPATRTSK